MEKENVNSNNVLRYFENPPNFYDNAIENFAKKIENIVKNNEQVNTDDLLLEFKKELEFCSNSNIDFFVENQINISLMVLTVIKKFSNKNRELIDKLVLCDKLNIIELDVTKLEEIPNTFDFEMLSEEFVSEDNKPVVLEDSTDVDKYYATIYGFQQSIEDYKSNKVSQIDKIIMYGVKFTILRKNILSNLKNSSNIKQDMENMGLDRVNETYIINQIRKNILQKDIQDVIIKNIKYHSTFLSK